MVFIVNLGCHCDVICYKHLKRNLIIRLVRFGLLNKRSMKIMSILLVGFGKQVKNMSFGIIQKLAYQKQTTDGDRRIN